MTTFIPREYTYYTCTAIMFLFGLKMLYEAWKMKPNEGEETQREVEEELARRGSSPSLNNAGKQSKTKIVLCNIILKLYIFSPEIFIIEIF